MPWQEISRGGARAGRSGVSISMNKTFVFTFGADLAKEVGFEAKKKVSMLLGTDQDAGKVRIMLDERGYYTLSPFTDKSEALKVQRQGFPGAADGKHPTQPVAFAKLAGGIEITLPPWAYAKSEYKPSAAPARTMPIAEVAVRMPTSPKKPSDIDDEDDTENETADNALIHAISECYRSGVIPSYADLSRLSKIPQGSIGAHLNRLTKQARITRDQEGIRPRGASPLRPRSAAAANQPSKAQLMGGR